MLLSVLSVLARLDIDPWLEAAKLACLPGEAATLRLASLIAALPDEQVAHPDPEMAAVRLVALLPRTTSFSALARGTGAGATTADGLRGIIFMLFFSAVAVALVTGVQWIAVNHQPVGAVDNPLQRNQAHNPLPQPPNGLGIKRSGYEQSSGT
jgi:hypothetical protein